MGKLLAVLLLITMTAAPTATADPEILVPACSEGQVPEPGACVPEPIETAELARPLIPGAFPGANPNIPPGLTPLNFPVVMPLGVTPFNVPSNLPLGPTPPTRLPFQQ